MSEEETLAALKREIEARNWKVASRHTDALRFRHKWSYNRFAETFGLAEWEEYANSMDDADTEE